MKNTDIGFEKFEEDFYADPKTAYRKLDTTLGTTPEYFMQELVDAVNVNEATALLKKLGIQVKTEDGNYRPLYDVLADIGSVISKNIKN